MTTPTIKTKESRGRKRMTPIEKQAAITSILREDRDYLLSEINNLKTDLEAEMVIPPESNFEEGFNRALKYVTGRLTNILDR